GRTISFFLCAFTRTLRDPFLFLALFTADHGEQAVEVLRDPAHRLAVEAVARTAAGGLAAHEARLAQHAQMLRDRALRERQAAHDVAAGAAFAVRERRKDAEPHGVRERAQPQGERL